ncbi:hypothetical protein AVEN_40512-1 [Araneus ventricosus]|uniref:Uncharacterized protein n=1 Tax=Araneus ventricosus TaxID=182803 RepID=A0A4Y2IMC4_ARAVE|nr:hypothetical protein AVEN_40512-1 [Araneus ventricosus]
MASLWGSIRESLGENTPAGCSSRRSGVLPNTTAVISDSKRKCPKFARGKTALTPTRPLVVRKKINALPTHSSRLELYKQESSIYRGKSEPSVKVPIKLGQYSSSSPRLFFLSLPPSFLSSKTPPNLPSLFDLDNQFFNGRLECGFTFLCYCFSTEGIYFWMGLVQGQFICYSLV